MKNSIISSKNEFDLMFKKYILPLLGLNDSGASFKKIEKENEKLVFIKDQELRFYESKDSDKCFTVKVSKNFPENSLNLLRTVYSELMKVRHKNYDNSVKNEYDSIQHLIKNYEYSIQKSLLNWFSGSNTNLMPLIEILESWKEKTYEGKKVPFAFLIDMNNECGKFPILDFLEEEYSATFSDGITSMIELDSKLSLLGFRSITDPKISIVHNLRNAPFRFSQVIETFTQSKIGIFLLVNGDIVLVKNCNIMLVKREGKWLNFSKEVFKSIISAELNQNDSDFLNLLDEIYLSALDVSFSHSGGIISCVINENIKSLTCKQIDNKSIIDELDNLLCVVDIPKKFDSQELKKRFLKRRFLLEMVDFCKFNEIDRNLRSELISMDGATILDFNGKIVSVGAIIQNDSGSYGGGRGAAAKKLSNYGFAVKISTDGYIEVYINGRIKYRIK